MIGQIIEYRQGTIELLGKDDAHHLMREGHLRQGDLALGKTVDLGREAIGTTDDKDKAAAHGIHTLLKPLGEATRGELLTTLIEQDNMVARLYELDDLLPLTLLLLLLREVLHIAYVGDDLHLYRRIVVGTAQVVVCGCGEVFIVGLADGDEESLHKVES